MSEKKNSIENLIEHGKQAGKLSTKAITDALEETDYDVDQIERFYEQCSAFNIEIIDDIVPEADSF